MEKQEIQERNKQIALMLGKRLISKNEFNMLGENAYTGDNAEVKWGIIEYLAYHRDWNWLHEGIKFLQKHFESKELVWTTIERYPLYSNIEDVFLMISDFAKFYNEKKI